MVRTRHGRYLSWQEWRSTWRRRALRPTCALCWGTGKIYEPFLDTGLIPVVCEGCSGKGRL